MPLKVSHETNAAESIMPPTAHLTTRKHQSTLIFNEYFPAVIVFGLPFEAVTVAVVPSGTSIASEAT